jgi:hypothetical protein
MKISSFTLGLQNIKAAQQCILQKEQEPQADMAWSLQENGNRVQEEV